MILDWNVPWKPIAEHSDLYETLDVLKFSTCRFYLGGSHYFGCARETSDFDFIAQYDGRIVEFLKEKGFECMSNEYDSVNIGSQTHGIYQKGTVQVQVVHNLKAVLGARDILSSRFAEEHKAADGPLRRRVWSALIDAIRNVEMEFAFGAEDSPF